MAQVTIGQDECLGCEACVELCPEVFAFDSNEGKAYVVNEDGGSLPCVEDAMASCPAACITCE